MPKSKWPALRSGSNLHYLFVAVVKAAVHASPTPIASVAPAGSPQTTWLPIFQTLVSVTAGALLGLFVQYYIERLRRQHIRAGVIRQLRTLLRRVTMTLAPYTYTYMEIQVSDVLTAYGDLLKRLSASDAGAALEDDEYTAVDVLVLKFGKAIAFQQGLLQQWSAADKTKGPTRDELEERHYGSAQNFKDVVEPLRTAGSVVGDRDLQAQIEDVAQRFSSMMDRAAAFRARDPR